MHDGAIAPDTKVRARPRVRKALVADLFCGAGGTDRGARKALEQRGFRMELVAVNHDEWAIASHRENFPEGENDERH